MYEAMHEWLEYANHPDSIVIVSGTQGNVVPIDEMLAHVEGYKILNNLSPSNYINASHFDQVHYLKATDAWLKIESYLDQNCLIV